METETKYMYLSGMAEFGISCPPSIVAHARQMLANLEADSLRDDRPWYLRWFIGRALCPFPPDLVCVQQFAECDVVKRTCEGAVEASWLVSGTTVTIPEKPQPWLNDALIEVVQLPVVNFAFRPSADVCVVNEVDIKGRICRLIFELPDGLRSERLGRIIGTAIIDEGPASATMRGLVPR